MTPLVIEMLRASRRDRPSRPSAQRTAASRSELLGGDRDCDDGSPAPQRRSAAAPTIVSVSIPAYR